MKSVVLAILFFFAVPPVPVRASSLHVGGFSARIVASEAAARILPELGVKISWHCVKPDWMPMSSTGYISCGKKYSGEITVKPDKGGNFNVPRIDVSGPWFRGGFAVDIELVRDGGTPQRLGFYTGEGHYSTNSRPLENLEKDIKELRLITIKGREFPARIYFKETGKSDISYDEIKTRYPQSYNDYVGARIAFTCNGSFGNSSNYTRAMAISGKYKEGRIIFPESIWAMSDYTQGDKISADVEFEVTYSIARNGDVLYRQASGKKTFATVAAGTIEIPEVLAELFRNVSLKID